MPFSKDKKDRPKKEKPKDRFTIVRKKMGIIMNSSGIYTIKDEATGVSYLTIGSGEGIALTPLLGSDGKPLIDPVVETETDLINVE